MLTSCLEKLRLDIPCTCGDYRALWKFFFLFFPSPPLFESRIHSWPLSFFFPFISAFLSFFLPLCFSGEPWLFMVHFHADSLGRCGCSRGDSTARGFWGERGHRLASRRDRCCPVYPGNSSGVSSHLDSGTSVTKSSPKCFAVPATALLHIFLLSKLPFPSTHFAKPRMPQTQSTDLLKFRLAFPEENFPS